MAPQNPPKKADASPVAELANTKELGPYWTNSSGSRRRSAQATLPPINTNLSKKQTKQSNVGSKQKSQRSKPVSRSNTRQRQKSPEVARENEDDESGESIMSSSSKTRLPKAAATYDLGIQDPELRQEIDASLLHNGHIATYVPLLPIFPYQYWPLASRIEKKLDHALSASPENWTDLIKKRCQELLRSGEAQTFDECLAKVLADVRADTLAATSATPPVSKKANGVANGNGVNGVNGVGKETGRGEGGKSLAVPKKVVDEGLRVTRECLELVCKEEGEE